MFINILCKGCVTVTDQKNNARSMYLGIELGSTRIKACLVDDDFLQIASGAYEWENKIIDGYWTYDIEEIHNGIRECYADLRSDFIEKTGEELTEITAVGISGMMHGYLVFDKNMKLLTPFRTWRNTMTEEAAMELSDLFGFNIPQRWSIAHLYQAILNDEPHVEKIAHITTVSGYIHYLLTGKHEIGICEGSGMFPFNGYDYDNNKLDMFDELVADKNLPWRIRDILPDIRKSNDCSTVLTEQGAKFLDKSENLPAGVPVCAPEGDAVTGMVATNSVKVKTGNISAGTSVFALLVLEKEIEGVYPEIDILMTPDAHQVALIHSNNGCSELDAWVKVFSEFAAMLGVDADKSAIYKLLYENALSGDYDCGEVVSYNCLAGEPVSGIEVGRPMVFRTQNSKFTLANFFRSQIYSAVAVLKIGMDMLEEKEKISADNFTAHGGLFKVEGVAQQLLANTLNVPVSISASAGEGGAWGMALLAAYSIAGRSRSLGQWLDECVFKNIKKTTLQPEKAKKEGYDSFFALYKEGLGMFNNI
ncbi:MAG: ATPase [Oscillospiraceae bacterium]|nr:ATPase [Oscillospiraceae bacterium]